MFVPWILHCFVASRKPCQPSGAPQDKELDRTIERKNHHNQVQIPTDGLLFIPPPDSGVCPVNWFQPQTRDHPLRATSSAYTKWHHCFHVSIPRLQLRRSRQTSASLQRKWKWNVIPSCPVYSVTIDIHNRKKPKSEGWLLSVQFLPEIHSRGTYAMYLGRSAHSSNPYPDHDTLPILSSKMSLSHEVLISGTRVSFPRQRAERILQRYN